MIFIGIDLAWTYKNETGICIIDDSGIVLRHEAAVFTNEALAKIILGYEGEVCVGIDGAIIVNNEGGSRAAEGLMMRDRFHGRRLQAFNSNRQYLEKAFGDIRGECLRDLLETAERSIEVTHVFGQGRIRLMEVFPTGVCVGMFPELYPMKYKVKGKLPFEETKSQLRRLYGRLERVQKEEGIQGVVMASDAGLTSISKKAYKHIEDEVDAFLCAYGMFSVYRGIAEQRIYGDLLDGFMMVPVRRI